MAPSGARRVSPRGGRVATLDALPPPAAMLARVRSAAVLGVDAYPVEVEVDLSNGLPSLSTVGLPQSAVKEGRERVHAAILNAGFEFPLRRITINLAPADRPEGRLRLRSRHRARHPRGQRAGAERSR